MKISESNIRKMVREEIRNVLGESMSRAEMIKKARQLDRRGEYTLDGEPIDLGEFVKANTSKGVSPPENLEDVLDMQTGDTVRFGGGAAASFALKRVK